MPEQGQFTLERMVWVSETTEYTYTFENFFHPFVGNLIEQLNKESLPGLFDPVFHKSLSENQDYPFLKLYQVGNAEGVKVEGSLPEIDTRTGGPYANYNWELLFHIPLTIAVYLSKNQRFAEAQRWFHYLFDPTSNDTSLPTTQRFWRFLPFRQEGARPQIDEQLTLLSKAESTLTKAEREAKDLLLDGYDEITKQPFQPHAVARTRHVAYQYYVVMKYLDNLIAWGDMLFSQDAVEFATQRYVLAANLLGPRPQRIPPRGTSRARTFKEIQEQRLDRLGNALVELESKFPFNLTLPQRQGTNLSAARPLFGIGQTLYFCIPRNEKLLEYWDIVGDRLFKIRNCMTIAGVVRQLALFDPPLDPGMLVKAAAAGITPGAVVSALTQPVGHVRALALIQKALELCAEVRSLGSALLSAIEKGDSERMTLLRQGHDIKLQQLTQEVRFLQWKQSQASTDALLQSRTSALERYHYYQRLLGLTPASDTFSLDRRTLTEENFDEAYATLVGQYGTSPARVEHPRLALAGADSPLNVAERLSSGQLYLTQKEFLALNVLPLVSAGLRVGSAAADLVCSILSILPYATVKVAPLGVGADVEFAIGQIFSNVGGAVARSIGTLASLADSAASLTSQTASHERRADEWILQNNLAAQELGQLGRQILGSLINEQIAHHEYLNSRKQVEYSQEIDRFLREKFTNQELYAWMQGELSRLYYEYYRFAFDTARKAEQTLKHELMRPETDEVQYIKFNYWDGGRKGLLAGEALYLDVKRMELAYDEHNRPEYELKEDVSLRQLDPLALLTLKVTGNCEFSLPEWLFDLDGAGHYLRRIKNIRISIPAVVGPYTGIHCTVRLQNSSIRKSPLGDYKRNEEDGRFIDYRGPVKSIVTSSGNNDSGMFETNGRDDRTLPFEGHGAISTWKLELPQKMRQFDYATIPDVFLHMEYTAREGGDQLKAKANKHIDKLLAEALTSELMHLFSLKHDFSMDWYRFLNGAAFTATIKKDFFPYMVQSRNIQINSVELYAIQEGQLVRRPLDDADLPLLTAQLNEIKKFELPPSITGAIERNKEAEAFLLFRYSLIS